MKKFILPMFILVAAALTGCASNAELIQTMAVGGRQDVFREAAGQKPIPAGYARLTIVASLKTHRAGIYLFDEKLHGTPDYLLLLNIDGQATGIRGDLSEENSEPRGLRDPEAGEGVRYRFNKAIWLKAGTHRLFVALPVDNAVIEREIALAEGTENTVRLEPIYGAAPAKNRPGFYGVTSFSEGIKGFRVILNGKTL